MPVDYNPRLAIADMPFGHEILVPGAEMLRVGGTRRGAFAPDLRETHRKDAVDHRGNGLAQGIFGDEAPPDVEQISIGHPWVAQRHPLEPGAGPEPVQR